MGLGVAGNGFQWTGNLPLERRVAENSGRPQADCSMANPGRAVCTFWNSGHESEAHAKTWPGLLGLLGPTESGLRFQADGVTVQGASEAVSSEPHNRP